jgi:hypothetical protein
MLLEHRGSEIDDKPDFTCYPIAVQLREPRCGSQHEVEQIDTTFISQSAASRYLLQRAGIREEKESAACKKSLFCWRRKVGNPPGKCIGLTYRRCACTRCTLYCVLFLKQFRLGMPVRSHNCISCARNGSVSIRVCD